MKIKCFGCGKLRGKTTLEDTNLPEFWWCEDCAMKKKIHKRVDEIFKKSKKEKERGGKDD